MKFEFVAAGESMGGCALMNLLNWCKGFIEHVGSVTTINSPLLGGNMFKLMTSDHNGAY